MLHIAVIYGTSTEYEETIGALEVPVLHKTCTAI